MENAIFERRSVRRYLPKAVEREKIEKVLKAGAYAPSALNDQSRRMVAVTNPEILHKLNEAVANALDHAVAARIRSRSESGEFNFYYHAPVLILCCNSPTVLRPAEDCACALENMFLQAFELGLGSCWINQLTDLCDLSKVRAVLDLAQVKPDHRIYGCCALGYADGTPTLIRPKTNETIIV